MRYDSVIYLVAVENQFDDLMQEVEVEQPQRKVFANRYADGREIDDEAGQRTFRPDYTFVIARVEYNNEPIVYFNNERLHVSRADLSGERIRLYLSRDTRDGR